MILNTKELGAITYSYDFALIWIFSIDGDSSSSCDTELSASY